MNTSPLQFSEQYHIALQTRPENRNGKQKYDTLEIKTFGLVLEFEMSFQRLQLKLKPFRRFCCLSNWTSHCTSNIPSHLTKAVTKLEGPKLIKMQSAELNPFSPPMSLKQFESWVWCRLESLPKNLSLLLFSSLLK